MAASPPNRFELKQTMRSTEYLREGGMGCSRINAEAELNLPPGFRFHPTDEELVVHYLCRKVAGQRPPASIIADVDLYKHNPWELPGMALFGSKEWYFYTPRDRKYPNGSRPNRAAGRGYWKATGADKLVATPGSGRTVGIKKALVFYQGKAPRGMKTDWIMHEYRLIDNDHTANKKGSQRLDEWVLCRLYHKKNSWEKGQQEKQSAAGGCSGRRMDSTEIGDDTRSDNLWTPESDIEQDAFLGNQIEPGISSFQASQGIHPGRIDANGSNYQRMEGVKASQGIHPGRIDANGSNYQRMEGVKEEVEWPMDLNPHGLQSTFEGLGSAPGVDFQDQDFYNSIIASFWS